MKTPTWKCLILGAVLIMGVSATARAGTPTFSCKPTSQPAPTQHALTQTAAQGCDTCVAFMGESVTIAISWDPTPTGTNCTVVLPGNDQYSPRWYRMALLKDTTHLISPEHYKCGLGASQTWGYNFSYVEAITAGNGYNAGQTYPAKYRAEFAGGGTNMSGMGDYCFNIQTSLDPNLLKFQCTAPSAGGGIVGGQKTHPLSSTVTYECSAQSSATVTVNSNWNPYNETTETCKYDASSPVKSRSMQLKMFEDATTKTNCNLCGRCKNYPGAGTPTGACAPAAPGTNFACSANRAGNQDCSTVPCGSYAAEVCNDFSCSNQSFTATAPATEGLATNKYRLEKGYVFVADPFPAVSDYYFNLKTWAQFPSRVGGFPAWQSGCRYTSSGDCWIRISETVYLDVRYTDAGSTPDAFKTRFNYSAVEVRSTWNVDTNAFSDDAGATNDPYVNITGATAIAPCPVASPFCNTLTDAAGRFTIVGGTGEHDLTLTTMADDEYDWSVGWDDPTMRLMIDNSNPSCTVSSLTESASNTYYPGSGSTMYYCNTAACGAGGYTIGVTPADSRSGVKKVNFPSPASLTGCGDDTTNPYSCAFTFTTGTTQNGAVTQTVYDNVDYTNTCAYTLTRDNTAPTGGAISYANGFSINDPVITLTNPTDALTGINVLRLDRDAAGLDPITGNCNAFPDAWTSSRVTNPGSPYTDTTVVSGYCYKYRYYTEDNVGNQSIYTSANVVKFDDTAPTVAINSPGASTWRTANFNVNVTVTDSHSGLDTTTDCQYSVQSNGVTTKAWTTYTCPNGSPADVPVTVGSGMDCRDQGANMCVVGFQATDRAGNLTTTSRTFSVDWTAPAEPTFSVSGCNYTSGVDCWVRYGVTSTHRVRHVDSQSTPATQYLTFTRDGCAPNGCGGAPVEIKSYVNTDTAGFTDWMASDTYLNITAPSCTEGGGCTGTAAQYDWPVVAGSNEYDYKIWVYLYDQASLGNGYDYVNYWLKLDGTSPTFGTVTPTNSDGVFIGGNFNVSTTFADARSGVASCQYCKSTDGVCDTEWAAATWSAGTCSITGLTCTDGQTVTLNMRAYDNVSNTAGTAVVISRTCEASPPTCSVSGITEGAGPACQYVSGTTNYYNNNAGCNGGAGGFTVDVSTVSGGAPVSRVNFPSPSSLTGCGDDSAAPYSCGFSYTSATTQSGAVTETVYDSLNNSNTCAYTLTRDIVAPTGGALSYTNGYQTATTITVNYGAVSDATSGMATYVMQYDSATLTTGACGSYSGSWTNTPSQPGSAAAGSINFTATTGNCYKFRYVLTDNVSNQTIVSGTDVTKVDTTAPAACTISGISEVTGAACQYVSGSTVYYNNNAACNGGGGSHTVTATSSDAQSGIQKLNFPATVSVGGDDTTSAYTMTYTYDSADTFSAAGTVTAYNNATLTNTCSFTTTRDIVAPTGGALSYTNGYQTVTTIAVSYGAVSDATSGMATYVIQYDSATLTTGTCGSYSGSWTNTTNQPGSTAAGSINFTATTGNCYMFRYVLTDNVSNQTIVSGTDVTKVDTTAPAACTISGISEVTGAACQYVSGSTVYYNNNAACNGGGGSHTVTATSSDAQSGIQKLNFPATVSVGGDDTTSAYTMTYTYDSADTFSAAGTVTAYNNATLTNTCSFTTTRDIVAPTGGALSYTNGYQSSVTITVNYGAVSDALSGMATYVIQYDSATLSAGSCGSYSGSWTNTTNQPGSTAAGSINFTATTGNCYMFRYVLTDNVSNQTIVSGTDVTKIDTTAPAACTISGISEVTGAACQYVSGSTVYYNNNAGCNGGGGSHTVTATSSDAESGIQKLNFPATVSVGGDDTTSAYTMTYTYDSADTFSAAGTVTVYNNSNLTNTCSFTTTRDIVAPTGGALSYTNGYQTNTTIVVNYGAVSDATSGMATYVIQYDSATLTTGSCGSYSGSWTNTTNQPGSTAAGSINFTATTGNCYMFRYVLTDNVSNQTIVSGTDVTKIDTSVPAACTISGISEVTGAACQYVSGSTVYYNNNAACNGGGGSHTVTATSSDAQSGIQKLNFPATVSVGGDDTTSAYTMTYTYDSADTFSAAGTVTAYNNAALTNTCSFTTTRDIVAPTGGALSYTNGYQTSTTIVVNYGAVSDATSGMATYVIQYDLATLSAGSCGSYSGSWTNTTNQPGSTAAGSINFTATSGNCYMFRYVLTDNVSNQTIVAGTDVTKIDDSTPPACSVSGISEVTGAACQYVSGSTVYYNNNAACNGGGGSHTVTATGSDAESGIQKLNFPNTVSAGGDDTTSAYTMTYTYDSSDSFSAAGTVTVYNNAGLTNTCSFTTTRDIAGPTGGAISHTNGYQTTTTIVVNYGAVSDVTSGMATYVTQYDSATLSNGACGSYSGSWTNTTNQPGSTAAGSINFTATTGNCYMFRYVLTDNVSNQTIVAGTDVTKVDTTAPAACTISGISEDTGAACQYVSGSTVYYNNNAACNGGGGSHTVTATSSDAESGIQKLNFPATVSVGGDDTTSAYTMTYTYDSSDSFSAAGTVTAYNNATLTNTCSFTTTRDVTGPTGGALTYTDGWQNTTSITVNYGAVSDAAAGIATYVMQYDTAALSGGACGAFSGSWTNTGNQPASAAAGSIAFTGADAVCYKFRYVLTDNVSNTTTVTSASVTKIDTTAPTGGALSYTNGYQTVTTIVVSYALVSDAASGVSTNVIQYDSATLSGGACGSYSGSWTNTTNQPASTAAGSINFTATSGNCYMFRYVITDAATNQTITAGTDVTKVDTSSPAACSISGITEDVGAACQYVTGSTVYYNNNAGCNTGTGQHTVTATSSDAESGLQKLNFPTTVAVGGDDTTSAYTMAYTYDSSDTYGGASTVTAYNNAGLTSICSFTVTRDITAPNTGSVTYTDGWYTSVLSVSVTFTNGTDAGAGVANRYIQRDEVALDSDGNCGTFPATWATVATNPGASPYADATVVDGKCYKYRYREVDRVSNARNYTTTNVAKVDTRDAYLLVTVKDSDGTSYGGTLGSTDNADGILNPNGSDYEIVLIKAMTPGDSVRTSSARVIDVTLGGGAAAAGAQITSCSWGACGPGTSVTGALSSGEAWVKVTATTAASTAVTVTAAPDAGTTSAMGGRDMSDSIIVATDSLVPDVDMSDVDTVASGGSQIAINHVWSHGGGKAVAIVKKNGGCGAPTCTGWNLYAYTYSGGVWGSETRLTNDDMAIRQSSRVTWSADDTKVIFSAREGTNNELYAVAADGSDANDSLATLAGESKKLSTTKRKWRDPHWAYSTCSNGYQDQMIASIKAYNDETDLGGGGLKLVRLYGAKNGAGLYQYGVSSYQEIIKLPAQSDFIYNARWSADCKKIVFSYHDIGGTAGDSRVSIYVLNVSDASFGGAWPVWSGSTITALSNTSLKAIHSCSTSSCPNGTAFYPAFTADGVAVSYMTAPTPVSFANLLGDNPDILGTFFTGENFDSYIEYINDTLYTPQRVGVSANNEIGLEQCQGASCPVSTNGKPFLFVTQSSATTGDLKMMTLDSQSNVETGGGLLFQEGAVVAVFPAGALSVETVISASTPANPAAGACGGYSVDCKDYLVTTGEAREFFPDGIDFNKDIRLIFHYNDADSNGREDSLDVDEGKLYVYYWCDSGANARIGCTENAWINLGGVIDKDSNTITVTTNHFSIYDAKALVHGRVALQAFVPLNLVNPHAYPNPARSGQQIWFGIDNTADNHGVDATTFAQVEIYDIRGKHVVTFSGTAAETLVAGNENGLRLLGWNGTNSGGKALASGVYLYRLTVRNAGSERAYTGKIAIIH